MLHVGHTAVQLYHNDPTDPDHDDDDPGPDLLDALHDDPALRWPFEDNNDHHYNSTNATAAVYYQHYGNITLGYSGVPFGWSAKPYVFVPGALASHHVNKYWDLLYGWQLQEHTNEKPWIHDFVHVPDDGKNHTPSPNHNNDDRPPHVDDDFYVNPPDDDSLEEFDDIVDEMTERASVLIGVQTRSALFQQQFAKESHQRFAETDQIDIKAIE